MWYTVRVKKLIMQHALTAFAPGRAIGPYRVVRSLGGGGMGMVYEVVHGALGTHFALKVFTLEEGDVDFLKNRFLVEGRILARLRNPRLVRVYDLGVDEETGSPYFTMDLVLGPNGQPTTLEQVRREGRVRESDAVRWYADIREALEAVHAAGVVHRDVKLENVLLDTDGHVVLSDFGVSRILVTALGKELDAVATTSQKTPEDKRVLGTTGYLAPEVKDGGQATAAADWYALGFLMFRLLTGVWYEPNTDAFELLAPFDPQWREVLGALLDPDPEKRRALPLDKPLSGRTALLRGRRRWLVALAAALVLGGVAALVGLSPRARRLEPLALPLADGIVLEFVVCPAGSFQMGLAGDHAVDSVRREHRVNIMRPFWFGKYPMTVAQWESATGETVAMTPEMEAVGKEKLPMNATKGRLTACCSNLTQRFAARLPRGYVFRPPTEAEWEYACRSGGEAEDVYNRFFRDDYWQWQRTPDGTNLYVWTDESLAALLSARGIAEIPSFTSWSGTRVFGPIGEHVPNAWGIHDLNVGGIGAIALDSIDPAKRATDGPGYGPGQTALVYADEETDPVRCGSTNAEAFIQLVFARGTHKYPMMRGASCRNTLRLVIGPDLLNPPKDEGTRLQFR